MEIETMDQFVGYTNQKGKRTDIAQRANPPFSQAWGTIRPTLWVPATLPVHLRDQHQLPANDQTHTPERLSSPSQADKFTTIHNILQAGVAALETIDNPNPEDTPKDVISLIKFISHKLITNEHNQDTKTIENRLEHLDQKIDHLTKTLTPPNPNNNIIVPHHRNPLPHTTHTTSRGKPNPQNPLARHHPSRLTIVFISPPPINECIESKRILMNVNNTLALSKHNVRIAGVT
jgi:hypothetical protein